MAELTLYGIQTPATALSNSPGVTLGRTLGAVMKSTIDTYVIGIRWYASSTLPTVAPKLSMWSLTGNSEHATTGTLLGVSGGQHLTFTLGSMVTSGWNRLDYSAPIAWPANTPRQFQIWTKDNYCFSSPDQWDKTNSTLYGYTSEPTTGAGNGRFTNDCDENTLATINASNTGYDFFVDVITNPNPPGLHGKGAEFWPFF